MTEPTLAQILISRSIAASRKKSGDEWCIRVQSTATAETAFTRPSFNTEDIPISPIEEEVGEREAMFAGHNVLTGDIKLRMGAIFWHGEQVPIDEKTILLCNGVEADVKKVDRFFNHNVVQEYRLYVSKRHD